jgi:hypothetical protein
MDSFYNVEIRVTRRESRMAPFAGPVTDSHTVLDLVFISASVTEAVHRAGYHLDQLKDPVVEARLSQEKEKALEAEDRYREAAKSEAQHELPLPN